MVQEIKGTSNLQSNLLMPETKKATGNNPDSRTRQDYKLSIDQKIVSTLTYTQSGRIESVSTDGATDLKDLVAKMLKRQGTTWEAAMAGEPVTVDDETRADAQALIADDGYWGVAKTSERIFQFAIAGAGGDPQKLTQIKGAVQKGFDMAQKAFGGTLPDISSKTLGAVMDKLDDWATGKSETD